MLAEKFCVSEISHSRERQMQVGSREFNAAASKYAGALCCRIPVSFAPRFPFFSRLRAVASEFLFSKSEGLLL